MITLVTGTPGSGKTCWTLSNLLGDYLAPRTVVSSLIDKICGRESELISKRPLYIHGIPGLNLPMPYRSVFCKSKFCKVCSSFTNVVVPEPLFNIKGEHVNWKEIEDANEKIASFLFLDDWTSWAVDGSIILIDEVQRVWRPRSASSAVPDAIAAFETHRHSGIDFCLVTQSPKLIDQNIRRLVNRHIHLVASWKGRMQYEWSEIQENTKARADAVSRPYRLDRSVFKRYKSASLHTKIDRRPPLQLFVMLVAAVFLVYILYDVYQRHASDFEAIEPAPVVDPKSPFAIPSSSPAPAPNPTTLPTQLETALASFTPDFTPRTPGRPETAPAYDGQLHIQSVPYPVSCSSWAIKDDWHCRCVTDQATPYPMPLQSCLAYARGEVYNPYIPPKPVIQPVIQTVSSAPTMPKPPKPSKNQDL